MRAPAFASLRASRIWWEELIALAASAAVAPTGAALTQLRHLCIRKSRPFPVGGVSALLTSQAFLQLGQAFCAGGEARRDGIAPALNAAGHALQRMIDEERDAAAACGRAVMAEGE